MSKTSAQKARPSLRSEQREVTRSRLRNAARTLFEEQGFGTTSIEDIAAQAGVARATVYLHYAGKEAIVADLLEEDFELQVSHFEWLAQHEDVDTALLQRWMYRLARGHQAREHSIALYGAVLNNEPNSGARYLKHREQLITILSRRFPAFAKASDNVRVSFAAHFLLIEMDYVCSMIGQRHFDDIDCAVTVLTDLFGNFLFRPDPPALPTDVRLPSF